MLFDAHSPPPFGAPASPSTGIMYGVLLSVVAAWDIMWVFSQTQSDVMAWTLGGMPGVSLEWCLRVKSLPLA